MSPDLAEYHWQNGMAYVSCPQPWVVRGLDSYDGGLFLIPLNQLATVRLLRILPDCKER